MTCNTVFKRPVLSGRIVQRASYGLRQHLRVQFWGLEGNIVDAMPTESVENGFSALWQEALCHESFSHVSLAGCLGSV